jgi:hypothetical protein
MSGEKKLEWWGKINTRGKLTITAFSTQLVGGDGGGESLFPW